MAVEDEDVDLYGDLPEPPKLAPPTAPKAAPKAVLNPALASHNGVSPSQPSGRALRPPAGDTQRGVAATPAHLGVRLLQCSGTSGVQRAA